MKAFLAAAAMSLFLAPTGLAATPEPAALDNRGVDAWLREYITWKGWTIIAADQQAVALGSPRGVEKLPDGTLRTQIRREYYRQMDIGGPARSLLMTWIVDCSSPRIRVTRIERYPDSNLSGASEVRDNPAADWLDVKPQSQNAQVVSRICDAPRTGTPLG